MLMLTSSCTPDFSRHLAGYTSMCHRSRVSKSGRHTNAHLRKNFHNLHKILDFERKTVTKNTSFNLMILTHFFCILYFVSFPANFPAHFFWLAILPAQWKSPLESLHRSFIRSGQTGIYKALNANFIFIMLGHNNQNIAWRRPFFLLRFCF